MSPALALGCRVALVVALRLSPASHSALLEMPSNLVLLTNGPVAAALLRGPSAGQVWAPLIERLVHGGGFAVQTPSAK
jgi:hypothetical protein